MIGWRNSSTTRLGRVVWAEGPSGVFEYKRNALGWVVRESQTVNGQTVVVDVERDLVGNVVRRSTSLGHSLVWDRDIMGQCTRAVLDELEEIQPIHDVLGREVARILPAGGRIDAAYDERDRLVQRRVTTASRPTLGQPAWHAAPAGVPTVEQAYRYSPASELLEAYDRAYGSRRFEHDAVGRLVAAGTDERNIERFAYDATGNLYERYGVERQYGQGDRLTCSAVGKRYTWDDDARLIQVRTAAGDGEHTVRYCWAANGLLEAVERSDGVRITFAYDPFARRVQKTVVRVSPGAQPSVESTTRYVWDGDALVHEITQRMLRPRRPDRGRADVLLRRPGLPVGAQGCARRAWASNGERLLPLPDRRYRHAGEAGVVRRVGCLRDPAERLGTVRGRARRRHEHTHRLSGPVSR